MSKESKQPDGSKPPPSPPPSDIELSESIKGVVTTSFSGTENTADASMVSDAPPPSGQQIQAQGGDAPPPPPPPPPEE